MKILLRRLYLYEIIIADVDIIEAMHLSYKMHDEYFCTRTRLGVY